MALKTKMSSHLLDFGLFLLTHLREQDEHVMEKLNHQYYYITPFQNVS
jgi:hypothetical protein